MSLANGSGSALQLHPSFIHSPSGGRLRSRHWHSPKRGAHTAEPSRPAAAPQSRAGATAAARGSLQAKPPPFRVSACDRPSLQAVDAGHGRREGGGVDPGAVRRQQAHRLQVAAGSRRPGFSRARCRVAGFRPDSKSDPARAAVGCITDQAG